MKLSVIIPVFSGEKTIIPLFNKINESLNGKYHFEVIFVFDYGRDKSWDKIIELHKEFPSIIRAYYLKQNYGQQKATLTGISVSEGTHIITMDEDLQHNPEYIPLMINEMKKGNFDIVYGCFKERNQSWIKKIFSLILRSILISLIPSLSSDYSPFRLIKSEIARKAVELNGRIAFIDDFLSQISENIGNVSLDHNARLTGKSSYSATGLIKLALSALIAYSMISTVLICAGVLLLIVVVIKQELFLHSFFLFIGLLLSFAGIAGIIYKKMNRIRDKRVIEFIEILNGDV
ncbi:MAG: glycosyltransferase [Bacteroidales bacterium]|nr:glycosyltransferase [Bacteroidales bacterium]